MVSTVMTGTAHQSIGRVKQLMQKHGVHSLPIVNGDQEPVGIVTSSDVLQNKSDDAPISRVMTRKIFTVPQYSDVSLAARVMRNQKVHHVLVTHEKKLVGILSSFDLLRLVEDHRFVMKNAPSENRKRGKRGQKLDDDS